MEKIFEELERLRFEIERNWITRSALADLFNMQLPETKDVPSAVAKLSRKQQYTLDVEVFRILCGNRGVHLRRCTERARNE
jgi:hypothetical protein